MADGAKRRRLVPADGFGRAVYDLMKSRRRGDGSQWEAEDLAAAMKARGLPASGTAVRAWIKGTIPAGDRLIGLAQEFAVEAEPLLRGEIKPINLPQDTQAAGEAGALWRNESEALTGLWRQITKEIAEYERRGEAAPTAQLALWLARLGAISGGGAGAAVSAEAGVERDATEATTLDANTPPPQQGRQQKPGG